MQDKLYVKLGLPYSVLEEEAEAMKLTMRLRETKGSCPFERELLPR